MRKQARPWVAAACLVAQTVGLFATAWGQEPAAPNAFGGEKTDEETTWQPVQNKHQTWGLIGSGVGLVAGVGLAIWVKAEADERYDRYLITADPEVASIAFNAAQRYDRATLIGWAMAQISFVSLVYFLTREGTRPLVSGKGEALIEPTEDGVRVGIRLRP